MIYREQKHPPGTFLRCEGCKQEPKHVQANGRHATEPVRIGAPSERHMLECPPCGRRTPLLPSLALAVAAWGENHKQTALPLRVVPRKAAAA